MISRFSSIGAAGTEKKQISFVTRGGPRRLFIMILGIMIKSLLGPPRVTNEICFFSVPAAPIDEKRDIIYHRGVFERIITECGYKAIPGNEAKAIIYVETAKDGFSGL